MALGSCLHLSYKCNSRSRSCGKEHCQAFYPYEGATCLEPWPSSEGLGYALLTTSPIPAGNRSVTSPWSLHPAPMQTPSLRSPSMGDTELNVLGPAHIFNKGTWYWAPNLGP